MTRPTSLFRLIDGPVVEEKKRREAMVRDMASKLIAFDSFRNWHDAASTLLALKYPTFDVYAKDVVFDAMQVAAQELVAVEMSLPQEAMP